MFKSELPERLVKAQLATDDELHEVQAAIRAIALKKPIRVRHNVKREGAVTLLRRTFNQKLPDGTFIKFWRIVAPETHRNFGSDLSIDGLKQWGVIR